MLVPPSRNIPSTTHVVRGYHSPFFCGRHRINAAPEEMPVPSSGSDGESGGTDGQGVVLEGRGGSLGRGRRSALYHPFRQPSYQLQRESPWAIRDSHRWAHEARGELLGVVEGIRESYRSCSAGGIASRGAGRARRTQC